MFVAFICLFLFPVECVFLSCFCISQAVHKAWWKRASGEALYKLILEECGVYILAAVKSLEPHYNDDPFVFMSIMEKFWLDFRGKLQYLCDIAGSEGQTIGLKSLWELGIEVFSKYLCWASNVSNKLLSIILDLIRDHK